MLYIRLEAKRSCRSELPHVSVPRAEGSVSSQASRDESVGKELASTSSDRSRHEQKRAEGELRVVALAQRERLS